MKKTVSFNLLFPSGFGAKNYMAVCEVDYSIDDNYGSDADGNRGQSRTFINDVEILYITNDRGNNVVNYSKKLKEAVEEKAGEQL